MKHAALVRKIRQAWRKCRESVTREVAPAIDYQNIPLSRGWKVCEVLLRKIAREQLFVRIDPHIAATTLIRTPYRTLDEYLKALEVFLFAMKKEEPIPKTWLSYDDRTISFERWMVSSDGFYMSGNDLKKFFNYLDELLEYIDNLEGEDTGTNPYNARLLYQFFARLRDTLTDLHSLQLAL